MQLSASHLSRCGVIQGPLIHPSVHHPLIHRLTPPIHLTLTKNRNIPTNIFWHHIREALGGTSPYDRLAPSPSTVGKAGRLELNSCKKAGQRHPQIQSDASGGSRAAQRCPGLWVGKDSSYRNCFYAQISRRAHKTFSHTVLPASKK